jgi:hypothetical protein
MRCIAARSAWRAGVTLARELSCSASPSPRRGAPSRDFNTAGVIPHLRRQVLVCLILLWSEAFVMKQTPSAYKRDIARETTLGHTSRSPPDHLLSLSHPAPIRVVTGGFIHIST